MMDPDRIGLLSEAARVLMIEHQAGHNMKLTTELVLISFFRVWGPEHQEGYDNMWKDIQKSLPRTCAKIEEWVNVK